MKISKSNLFILYNIFLELSYFSSKMFKICKNDNVKFLADFLVGTDSEWFKTYFKRKISKSKILSLCKFFSCIIQLLAKTTQVVKSFSQKWCLKAFFSVGIDSEYFKPYFKRKYWHRNFFPILVFFWHLVIFGQKGRYIEKMTTSKLFWSKCFW